MSNGLTVCVSYHNSIVYAQQIHIRGELSLYYCLLPKLSYYSTALYKPVLDYIQPMVIYIYVYWHLFVSSHFLTYCTAIISYLIQCNLIYYSITENYEALGQQDKPNVYDFIKNKEGKQQDITKKIHNFL